METSVEICGHKVTLTAQGLKIDSASGNVIEESFEHVFPKLEYLFRAGQMLQQDAMLKPKVSGAVFTDGSL